MKKIKYLILFSLLAGIQPAQAANGFLVSVDSIFVPIGRSGTTDTRTITMMYGVKGFSELHENWRLTYGLSTGYHNGLLTSLPISIAYVPTGNYQFNLRPQIFVGIEPFYSTIPDFQGLKLYGHGGLAIDYIFDNRWIFNIGTKLYINDSLFKKTEELQVYGFNTGTLAAFAGAGYKW